MRTHTLVLSAIVVMLLGAAAAQAQTPGPGVVDWSFTITPVSAFTPQGGTVTWTYDISNLSTSTENLVVLGGNTAWLSSFFANLPHMADQGLDFVPPAPIGPGGNATGDFYHIAWLPTVPIGTHVGGGAFVDAMGEFGGTLNPQPGSASIIPIEDTVVTPELPPSALGLLSFLPYGIWRVRMKLRRT